MKKNSTQSRKGAKPGSAAVPAASRDATIFVSDLEAKAVARFLTVEACGMGSDETDCFAALDVLRRIVFVCADRLSICPECGSGHRRGPVNGDEAFRCLHCGTSYTIKIGNRQSPIANRKGGAR